jgi:zinc transporter
LETLEATYGSDRGGLVWGYLFEPGGPARLVDCDAAAQLLGAPTRSSGWFLWLHFSLSNAASERWLRQNLTLPEAFHESLHQAVGSTWLEQDGDSLLAVIHDGLFEFTFDASDVSTVSLCIEPRVLVSARPRPLRSLDRERRWNPAGA